VVIVTILQLEDRIGVGYAAAEINFLFFIAPRLTPRPIQLLLGALFKRVKRPEDETDHKPPRSVFVQNM
jgi:hypothetical protein